MTLHTNGNKIYDENGNKVILRGVNCSALEWSILRSSRLESCIEHALTQWDCNVIRLPLSASAWFGQSSEQKRYGFTALSYQNRVKRIVSLCAKHKAYIILDLHGAGEGERLGGFKNPMPDKISVRFWQSAAEMFCNEENVLFGLFNEPRDIDAKTLMLGGEVVLEGARYETIGMKPLLDAVRSTGANNICVIGGTDWAYDLRPWTSEFAFKDKAGNGIVIDSHIYPWKDTDWEKTVGCAAEDYPVIIGEFGHYGDDVIPHEAPNKICCDEFFEKLFCFIEKHDLGFLAWDMSQFAGPCLIKSQMTFEPTEFFGRKFIDFMKKYNGK